MPDANSPIVFKCKFKFFTTQRTKPKIGKVSRQIVKRKFDLTNVMNDEIYKVDTIVGETEIYNFFYNPEKGEIAIVLQDPKFHLTSTSKTEWMKKTLQT